MAWCGNVLTKCIGMYPEETPCQLFKDNQPGQAANFNLSMALSFLAVWPTFEGKK